jgi:glutathione-specific gamma-glutamylcyclotransferase
VSNADDETPEASQAPVRLTREFLRGGGLRRAIGADPTVRILTDEERAASIAETFGPKLGSEDVWVFAYGSLMWNPTFLYAERRIGIIRGYHRRFCLWTTLGRGTTTNPGLMLALEPGGACRGVAFRIAAAEAVHEVDLIWRREMIAASYIPRWVEVATKTERLRAVAFVMDRGHERYAGKLPEERLVPVIANACGRLGTCADYLFETVAHLEELGIRDAPLTRLRDRVATARALNEATAPDET